MGGRFPFPLLCIVLLASNIPLWANPLVTDRRDGDKGSPIEPFTVSAEPGIQDGDSSLLAASEWSRLSSNGFSFGSLPLFSPRLTRKAPPVQIGVLFEGCTDGPACLVEPGLMLRF